MSDTKYTIDQRVLDAIREQEMEDDISLPDDSPTSPSIPRPGILLTCAVLSATCGALFVYGVHAHLVGWWAMPMMIVAVVFARFLPGNLGMSWRGWVAWWDGMVYGMWQRGCVWVIGRMLARRAFQRHRDIAMHVLDEVRQRECSTEEEALKLFHPMITLPPTDLRPGPMQFLATHLRQHYELDRKLDHK